MQKVFKRGLLVAMLALTVVALCACTTTSQTPPTAMPTVMATPMASPSVGPESTVPAASPAAEANLTVTVEGKTLTEKGMTKDNVTWLPLAAVAEALGYTVTDNAGTTGTTGTAAGTGSKTITLTQISDSANSVQITYMLKDNTISDVQVTRGGTAVQGAANTAANGEMLMMQGTTLYASEQLLTDALMAKVQTTGTTVAVTKGTPSTT